MSNHPTIEYSNVHDYGTAGTARDMGSCLGQIAYRTENPFTNDLISRFAYYLNQLRTLYRGSGLTADQLLDEFFIGYCNGIDFERERPDESL